MKVVEKDLAERQEVEKTEKGVHGGGGGEGEEEEEEEEEEECPRAQESPLALRLERRMQGVKSDIS